MLYISTVVDGRVRRRRRQLPSNSDSQRSYPYSSSNYGTGSYYPSGGQYSGSYPYNTYGGGSMYGTNYGTGMSPYGTGMSQYGTGMSPYGTGMSPYGTGMSP
ncbi:unnamed protein product, partial [Rotaria sp. Silwood1]